MKNEIHEECGVFGIYSPDGIDVASACYYGLYALQHRGQESCGIAVNDKGVIHCYKNVGLVNEVFTKEAMSEIGTGCMAIAHARYGTAGTYPRRNAQPLVVNHIKGTMALAHNGALTNATELREKLELGGSIFHTTSDTEVITHEIIQARLTSASIEEAVSRMMDVVEGAYSLVIMSPKKLIAVRDKYGFRPLCMGTIGQSTVFASESCALDSIGATFVRDIKPGEIVIVDKNGVRSDESHVGIRPKSSCVFEYIYFARPDSVIDGSSVHIARQRAGSFLALEHPVHADVVVGVPDSGIDAAVGYARQSGIPYGIGFIKNKYIGRTFIQPVQADREDKVRIKLNPVSAVVSGKRVVLVDDSIVRGTTSAIIVKLLRDAGAAEVHVRISCPPFTHPCYFGTDIDSCDRLIACRHTLDEIRDIIGADSLGFLSCENVRHLCDNTTGFCDGCFTGDYPCPPPEHPEKNRFERKIMEDDI
ncbi:MAG: amidophosphoribosyltransferase [Clostridia bacterium]|nr:amidophosphoribosyltransferase [Clostridia bacterium]